MDKKNIIAVDDEPLIAILMKEIIEEDSDLEITKIVSQKEEFLEAVTQQSYHAALIDISVGGREGGLDILKAVRNKGFGFPLVILSAHDEIHYALKCLQAGARGYINKKYICTDVVSCLKRVLAGGLFVSGDKGEQILKQYKKSQTPTAI